MLSRRLEKRTKDGERRGLKVSEGTGIFLRKERDETIRWLREARQTTMEEGPRTRERETCRFDETVGIEG